MILLKRIQLQEVADGTLTSLNTVKAELEEMREQGEILGTYVAEEYFLAYSKDEENDLVKTILAQGISIVDLSRRFNLSKQEAIKLLGKIVELRKIAGLYTHDNEFFYSCQALKSKLATLLSQ